MSGDQFSARFREAYNPPQDDGHDWQWAAESEEPEGVLPRGDRTVAIRILRAVQPPPNVLTVPSFVAIERPPIEPVIVTEDGRSTLLTRRETMLLLAGPSGLGKSIASQDLGGMLAGDGGRWFGFELVGGLNVLLLSFEGSDEDHAERLGALIPEEAGERFRVWDRWRGEPIPKANEYDRLAPVVREHQTDVLIVDTLTAFFTGVVDVTKGIPAEAHDHIEELRRRSGRPLSLIGDLHTRKAARDMAVADQLEEIAGTIHQKADAAIVMRREEGSKLRRRIYVAKTRRGPEPPDRIVTLPEEGDVPRFELVTELEPDRKASAAAIAAWVREQPGLVSAAQVREEFEISKTTERDDRRPALEDLDVHYDKLPGTTTNEHGYGTPEQWAEGRLL